MGQVYGLFQTPVIVQKAKNQEAIKKYMLEEVFPDNETIESNLPGTEVYTDYDDKSNGLDQERINHLYHDNIQELLSDMQFPDSGNWRVSMDTWYNFSRKGGYQHMHDHVGGPLQINWSGVHYVVFDKEEHQGTNFTHPQAAMIRSLWPTTNKNDIPAYCNDLDTSPPVEEGDIVWFPSYLNHYVRKQESDKLRCTVAINLHIFDHPSIGN